VPHDLGLLFSLDITLQLLRMVSVRGGDIYLMTQSRPGVSPLLVPSSLQIAACAGLCIRSLLVPVVPLIRDGAACV